MSRVNSASSAFGGSGNKTGLVLPQKPTFTARERELVGHWKNYLKWEESNPLDMEDATTLRIRVQAAYAKAITALRFFPEIWYWYFHWTLEKGKAEDAIAVLKAGMDAIPGR